jgi:hypothetical protein
MQHKKVGLLLKDFCAALLCSSRRKYVVRSRATLATVCPQCGNRIEATREALLQQGDPRNSLLGLHLDGFQASRTTQRSAAVADIFPLTASSKDRAAKSKDLLWPLGFPPQEDVPNGADGLDFFHLALTPDFLDSYLVGIEVPYALASHQVFPGLPPSRAYQPVRIRTQLLCTIANQPAQSEVSKTKQSGYHVSRKCSKQGELNERRRVVYTRARQKARQGCSIKSPEQFAEACRRHLEADENERKAIARNTGVTGYPMLQILSSAYGFQVTSDSPNDWTHMGPLNMVRGVVNDLVIPKEGDSPNKGRPREERDPAEGPTMTVAELAEGYSPIRFTRQLSAGRKPPNPKEKSWGSLKAEDLQKLAEHALESMAAGYTGESQFAICSLVSRIHQLVFRTELWGEEERFLLAQMCLAKQIRSDELYGPRSRPLEHEAAFHTMQDLVRFGPIRKYWTERNERYIKHLTRIPNNGKDFEATFSNREYRKLVSSHFRVVFYEDDLRKKGVVYSDAEWEKLRGRFDGGILFVPSQVEAKRVFEQLPLLSSSSQGPEQIQIVSSIQQTGILVGSHPRLWRPRFFKALSPSQFLGVRKILEIEQTHSWARGEVRNQAVQQKSITVGGVNFAPGDFVVFKGSRDGQDEQYGRLEKLFLVQGADRRWHAIFECSYFKVMLKANQRVLGAPHHNMVMLGERQLPKNSSRMKAAQDVLRHFIPYPDRGQNLETGSSFRAIETNRKGQDFLASDIYIPVWPQVRVCNLSVLTLRSDCVMIFRFPKPSVASNFVLIKERDGIDLIQPN